MKTCSEIIFGNFFHLKTVSLKEALRVLAGIDLNNRRAEVCEYLPEAFNKHKFPQPLLMEICMHHAPAKHNGLFLSVIAISAASDNFIILSRDKIRAGKSFKKLTKLIRFFDAKILRRIAHENFNAPVLVLRLIRTEFQVVHFLDFFFVEGFLSKPFSKTFISFSSPICPLKYSFIYCERRNRNAIAATALRSSMLTSSRPSAAAYA